MRQIQGGKATSIGFFSFFLFGTWGPPQRPVRVLNTTHVGLRVGGTQLTVRLGHKRS